MGIFTAGVLEEIHKKYRGRIHSIYGSSSGADVGVYFLSNQPNVPYIFFKKYLASKDFIRGNMLLYALKIFLLKKSTIQDYIDIEYVERIAKESECAIDLPTLEQTDIQFFIKAINTTTAKGEYLPAQPHLFDKLKASSQTGPFSSRAIQLGDYQYIDGGTLPADIERDIIQEHSDKTVIYIEPGYTSLLSKIILYPLHLVAGAALATLFSKRLGKRYVQDLWKDPMKDLSTFDNVVHIKNAHCYSGFCTDKEKLEKVYRHGRLVGEKLEL